MRCLSLARELRLRGAQICFAALEMPAYLVVMIEEEGYRFKRLPTSARCDAAADVRATLDGEYGVWACILDHYELGPVWESLAQEHAPVLALDDLGRDHVARWVLDQNFYAEPVRRYAGRLAKGVQPLWGPMFALLRPEFEAARKQAKVRDQGIRRVLVFFGGMDADNVTIRALQAVEAGMPDSVEVTVIAGASHPALASLEAWCVQRGTAELKVQVKEIAPHLLAADLAIGAGGSSTWERCACGLPTVTICLADNQREVVREGAAAGFLLGFDSVPEVGELAEVLRVIDRAPGLLAHLSRQALAVTDARGARRVADVLLPRQVQVRTATEADARMIYEWRTHASVLDVSRVATKFSYDDHRVWMRGTLADPDRILLVGVHEGRDIGVIRFDIEAGRAEVSIFLAPDTAGAGLGGALLTVAERQLKASRPDVRWLDAWVSKDNPSSLKMFNRLGYSTRISRLEKEVA